MKLKEVNFINDYNYILFSKYLSDYQWINDGKYNDIFTVWHRKEDEYFDYEIVIPEKKEIRCLERTLQEALRVLAVFYKKTVSSIIDDYYSISNDLIKLQIKSENTKNGLIPLNEGVRLIENTKEMLTASFLAAKKYKKNYIGQRPQPVNELLDKVDLGQTEEGSFVLNIFLPNNYYEDETPLLIPEESFSRKALKIFTEASKELTDKAIIYAQTSDINIFHESFKRGVSSNLCSSIVEISANGTNDVNIDIVYNNGLEVDEVVESVSFTKELIPIIQKVADYYKKDLLEEDFEIIGYVTKLHQEIEEEKGEITLSCLLEEKLKKVKMILNEEQYLIAQEAHKNKKLLACRGTLNMFDRSTILSDVTSVLIEENEL
ncbi:hypothetical protein KP612_06720 [Treponema denticola]|uniref:Uncharacterized protein n=1 Tax=Treponema denticola H-22 TaxID=999432 RepID=A0A0E2E6V3_TREDN|nr:hypothetical protein [Treponema denticola]EMB35401.1 hypothetical protein HMPREF9726_00542 [Treponema denticola H-22]